MTSSKAPLWLPLSLLRRFLCKSEALEGAAPSCSDQLAPSYETQATLTKGDASTCLKCAILSSPGTLKQHFAAGSRNNGGLYTALTSEATSSQTQSDGLANVAAEVMLHLEAMLADYSGALLTIICLPEHEDLPIAEAVERAMVESWVIMQNASSRRFHGSLSTDGAETHHRSPLEPCPFLLSQKHVSSRGEEQQLGTAAQLMSGLFSMPSSNETALKMVAHVFKTVLEGGTWQETRLVEPCCARLQESNASFCTWFPERYSLGINAPSSEAQGEAMLALGLEGRAPMRMRQLHKIVVKKWTDPSSNKPYFIMIQKDVMGQAENMLLSMAKSQLNVLASSYPRHVLDGILKHQGHLMEDSLEPSSAVSGMLSLSLHAENASCAESLQSGTLEDLHIIQSPPLPSPSLPLVSSPTMWTDDGNLCTSHAQLARYHKSMPVLMLDVAGYTKMSHAVSPMAVMGFINSLFSKYDLLCSKHGVLKVQTAGDGYVVAGGIIQKDDDTGFNRVHEDQDPLSSAAAVFAMAKEMLAASQQVMMPHDDKPASIRIGLHIGPGVSGLVGNLAPRFTICGNVLTTCAQLERSSKADSILMSPCMYELLYPVMSDMDRASCSKFVSDQTDDDEVVSGFTYSPQRKGPSSVSSDQDLIMDHCSFDLSVEPLGQRGHLSDGAIFTCMLLDSTRNPCVRL